MSLATPRTLLRVYHELRRLHGVMLGMDVGERYVGIAIGDTSHTIASPYTTLYRKLPSNTHTSTIQHTTTSKHQHWKSSTHQPLVNVPVTKFASQLNDIIQQQQISCIIVGVPLEHTITHIGVHSAPRANAQTIRIVHFMKQLLPYIPSPRPRVVYWDESYSTDTAESYMYEAGVRDDKKKHKLIDKMSAAVILQDFMDRMHATANKNNRRVDKGTHR